MVRGAIRTLVRATEAVLAYVLFAGGGLNGLVPVPQFDQFEHLGQPAVQPGHEGDAAAFWDAVSRERDAYAAGVEDERTRSSVSSSKLRASHRGHFAVRSADRLHSLCQALPVSRSAARKPSAANGGR
jgi:hypothetical protein